MYEVIKVIDQTKIEVIERKFRFKFTAQNAANRLNSAARPTGLLAAIGNTGPRWQVQSTKTVTAMLANALTAAEKAEAVDRIAAQVSAELVRKDPRDTQEIMKAINEGHEIDDKPARAPRGARTRKRPETLVEAAGAENAARIEVFLADPDAGFSVKRPLHRKTPAA